ncbi:MAG: hypothetical protein ACIAXF_14510 [Phycisphaerales bacterium JB063]
MTDMPFANDIQPGRRVRVIQQVARQGRALTAEVVGTVVATRQAKTGSWFAHAKDDRLWLDRLELRKDDGEITVCNIDAYTRVEVLDAGSGSEAVAESDDAGGISGGG